MFDQETFDKCSWNRSLFYQVLLWRNRTFVLFICLLFFTCQTHMTIAKLIMICSIQPFECNCNLCYFTIKMAIWFTQWIDIRFVICLIFKFHWVICKAAFKWIKFFCSVTLGIILVWKPKQNQIIIPTSLLNASKMKSAIQMTREAIGYL